MDDIDLDKHMERIARHMTRIATMLPWDGRPDEYGERVIENCRYADMRTGATLLFTEDFGHCSGGWFKNPDYERCFHLSISSLAALLDSDKVPELTDEIRKKWVQTFFRENVNMLWIEPPSTKEGKSLNVWHYRLFVDNRTKVVLLPRGEVYSREPTEKGWKSWGELYSE